MRKISFVLCLLLLLSSCGRHDFTSNVEEPKSRGKRGLSREKLEKVQKTLEEALREKLNEDEKKGLDLLKEALGDDDRFDQLLSLNEDKLKAVFRHIYFEITSCTGNNAEDQKKTFKYLIKGYFENNNNNLDNIVGDNSQLKINCNH